MWKSGEAYNKREDRKVNIKEICYAYLGYFQLDNNGTNN